MLPLKEKPVSQTLVTDAFMTGWGAHLGQMQVSGVWARDLALQHTHYLEMMAVFLAIQYFQKSMRDQKVLVKTDNTTVMTYIKKGDTFPIPMHSGMEHVTVSHHNNIAFTAQHIAGKANILADLLPRRSKILPTEWMLNNR